MIRVSVEICEGGFTQQARVTAPSIALALQMAAEGKPGRGVRLLFPIDPEAFFVPEGADEREAA
jgi:hypothetical protein